MRLALVWAAPLIALLPSCVMAQEAAPDIQHLADTMVRLCVGGGRTETMSGGGTGGADLSVRSLDVKGNLRGEFKIGKSSAEGLVNGIDNALSQVAANQADKVRSCLQPLRDRLLNLWLPAPRAGSTSDRLVSPGKYLWVDKNVTISCNMPINFTGSTDNVDPIILFVTMTRTLARTVLEFGEQNRPYQCSFDLNGVDVNQDSHHAYPKKARALMEAQFKEQGRNCGLVWFQTEFS